MSKFTHTPSRTGDYMLAGGSARHAITESPQGTAAESEVAYARAMRLVPAPLSAERKAAILASPRVIPTRDFIRRIASATWAKVQAAANAHSDLDRALFLLSAGAEVHSDNAELIGLLAQLAAAGVITDAERVHILDF